MEKQWCMLLGGWNLFFFLFLNILNVCLDVNHEHLCKKTLNFDCWNKNWTNERHIKLKRERERTIKQKCSLNKKDGGNIHLGPGSARRKTVRAWFGTFFWRSAQCTRTLSYCYDFDLFGTGVKFGWSRPEAGHDWLGTRRCSGKAFHWC